MSGVAVRKTKQLLRKEIKKRLASISTADKQRQSEFVVQKVNRESAYKIIEKSRHILSALLLDHPAYQKSRRISVYLPMLKEEVNTEGILTNIFSSGKQKACFIPQYIGPKMEMLRLHSMEDYKSLPVTKWNIKQPSEDEQREEALSSGGLDLIIMPGLAFTTHGDRLGRGKGYYDQYLSRCSKHPSGMPKTIAVAFNEQILETVPVTEDDQKVDYVLFADIEEG